MKKVGKILCFALVLAAVFGSMAAFSYAAENAKNYYYIDAINGDDSNSGTEIDRVEKDFFGDMIQSDNIGCYAGTGTDTEYEEEGILELIIRTIKNFFQAIWHEIYVIFD